MVKIHMIDTGHVGTDGGAMFGVVPKTIWQKLIKPDEHNRVLTALRSLLIVDGQRNILIDTGIGNYHDEKFNRMFAPDKPNYDFDDSLKQHGCSKESITDVIMTHLHFDHAGGLLKKQGTDLICNFPNAHIWLQKKQWDWANNPSVRDKAGFPKPCLDMLREHPRFELVEGETKLFDYLTLIPLFGHTPAMQAVLIESGQEKHFFASDLVPMATHLRLPYIMAFDLQPQTTLKEKQKFLTRAIEENWLIYFQHDPNIPNGRVEKQNERFTLAPAS